MCLSLPALLSLPRLRRSEPEPVLLVVVQIAQHTCCMFNLFLIIFKKAPHRACSYLEISPPLTCPFLLITMKPPMVPCYDSVNLDLSSNSVSNSVMFEGWVLKKRRKKMQGALIVHSLSRTRSKTTSLFRTRLCASLFYSLSIWPLVVRF